MNQPGPNQQLNLVLSIVAPVIAVITALAFWFTKPVPVAPAPPAPVNVAAAKLPDPGVQYVNALPNAGSGSGGGVAGGPSAGGGAGAPGGGKAGRPGFSASAMGK